MLRCGTLRGCSMLRCASYGQQHWRHARLLCTEADEIPGLRRTAFRKQLARQRVKFTETPRPVDGPIARVANVAVKPQHRDALVADYGASVRDAYEQQAGFVGAVLLLEGREPALKACSITMWEAQRDLDAAVEAPAYGEAMQRLASHFNEAPETQTWEMAAAYLRPKDYRPSPRTAIKTTTVVVEEQQ